MKISRRRLIQSTAALGASSIAVTKNQAADPYAPADGGLVARWFDKNNQQLLPHWAFSEKLLVPPTPVPTCTESHGFLKSEEGKNAFGDGKSVGKVLHGVAMEWDGDLIGGNKKGTAWATMQDRVMPMAPSGYDVGGILDGADGGKLANWEAYGQVRCYKIQMKEILLKLRPDAAGAALLYSYAGMVPGPTFRFRHGMPCVVRFENLLQTETSIHHHGGHTPSHSDGFPSFYVLQNQARDYLYPNILPLRLNEDSKEVLDYGEGQSTTWYHDHGLDATAFNVSHGLAGFALWFDDLELELIRKGVLPGFGLQRVTEADGTVRIALESLSGFDPGIENEKVKLEAAWKAWKEKSPDTRWSKEHARAGGNVPEPGGFYSEVTVPYFNPYDIPIALQDRVIDLDTGQIVYESDGHNGYIGNTQLLNGVAWPVLKVKRRKYRFRLLDGSNARIYRIRFLDSETFRLGPGTDGQLEPSRIPEGTLENRSMDFLRIGKDSWLWAKPRKMKSVMLNMANRADLILDFDDWYTKAERTGRLVTGENGGKEAIYYMVNTMPQFDGRGPKGKLAEDAGDPQVFPLPFALDPTNPIVAQMRAAGILPAGLFGGGPQGQVRELDQPVGLMKIIIEDDRGEGDDASIDEDTLLRPRHTIKDEEVMAVREFVFDRGKGAWMINERFYDPTISNANPIGGMKEIDFKVPSGDGTVTVKPTLTYAEEWILRNGGGGWWHPIHIHLEGHQLVAYEKDFAADGLIDGDGVLGDAAQANMIGLPRWGQMVTRFAIDPLIRQAGAEVTEDADKPGEADATRLNYLRKLLLEPDRALGTDGRMGILLDVNVSETYRATPDANPTTVRFKRGAPTVLRELRANENFVQVLNALGNPLRNDVNLALDGLDQLALQWVGEMTGNHDTQALGPNTIARIRMRFRTFSGPFVFHCHNVEHEDMRMMVNFEPTLKFAGGNDFENPNSHDPDIYPTARTHGQDVTDLKTNPNAIGELPWTSIEKFANHWEEKPVPYTPTEKAGDPLIKPRTPKNQ